jgi:hypothetical protein
MPHLFYVDVVGGRVNRAGAVYEERRMAIGHNTKPVSWIVAAIHLAIALSVTVCAGSKVLFFPKPDYFSGNGKFMVRATYAERAVKPSIQVYEIKDGNQTPLWDCVPGNERTPEDAFVSDDGEYVVTKNDYRLGAVGDYVLAFYHEGGLIKHYSLEQVLGYPGKIAERELYCLTYGALGDPEWAETAFVREVEGRTLFFAWLGGGHRWMAWDAATGDEVEVTLSLVSTFDKLARQWASQVLLGSEPQFASEWYKAVQVLRRFRDPEDRKLIEPLLHAEDYYTSYLKNSPSFKGCYAVSGKREVAEEALRDWDDAPPVGNARGPLDEYRYLGVISGTIALPSVPTAAQDNWLCLYLLPESSKREDWYSEVPVHRLTVLLESYNLRVPWSDKSIPFAVHGVTPGRYYLKAVWDCSYPNTFRYHSISGPPSAGDYENRLAPLIDVTAEGVVSDIVVDCTQRVSGRSVTQWSSEIVPSISVDHPPCPCGNEHGKNRICVVFNKPLPLPSFRSGLHFYCGQLKQVRAEGANTIYDCAFEKVLSDPNRPRDHEFDTHLEMVVAPGGLTRVTVEGPYFSVVPLRAFMSELASAVYGRTSDLIGQTRLYGGPVRPMNPQQVPLSRVIQVLGEPSERKGDEVTFNYRFIGGAQPDGKYWVRYKVTGEGMIVKDRMNLAVRESSFMEW